MLLFSTTSGSFRSLKESGEKVWRTFERIREDERHTDVIVAEVVETEARIFGNWWMGLATRNRHTESIFAAFSMNGRLDPRSMSASQMLTLMTEISHVGLSRKIAVREEA